MCLIYSLFLHKLLWIQTQRSHDVKYTAALSALMGPNLTWSWEAHIHTQCDTHKYPHVSMSGRKPISCSMAPLTLAAAAAASYPYGLIYSSCWRFLCSTGDLANKLKVHPIQTSAVTTTAAVQSTAQTYTAKHDNNNLLKEGFRIIQPL